MLLYRIEVELTEPAEDVGRKEQVERANAMQSKIDLLFGKCEHAYHITVTSILYKKQKSTLCAAFRKGVLTESLVAEFLSEIDMAYDKFNIQEITLEAYFNLLRSADRNDFIADDDDVAEKLNISGLDKRSHNSSISYSETIVSGPSEKEELMNISSLLLCDASLPAELERIFQGASVKNAGGHPVHYLIQSDNHEIHKKMLKVLISALHRNGRLESRRYSEVSYEVDDYLSEKALDLLYESSAGGTVVVSLKEDDGNDGEHARVGTDIIVTICEAMRKARNSVLTVFCLPKSSPKVKDIFLEHLGAVTVVSICEEAAFGERAKGYLRDIAKTQGIRTDKSLYKQIAEGKGYSSADLNLIYDEWYDRRLKTKVYSQYADLDTANKQVAQKKPKGSAFDELSGMIGLQGAKDVIRQALDYYKAQKLFQKKGFPSGRPAMHMVFTGNPGTAKTTVARLFAQIMKDNDLLSVGDLFEVGRADLVGKYVGWTAPTVKQKFKAAKGSVLFIDEAYSLVEDREGLYGDEAINTIVQEMENYREDMVVIFAGYPEKMEGFLQKNPGLRSRIAFHVPFADYDAQELCQITQLLAEKKKMRLGDGVREKLLPIYESALKTEDFGNGRFARNMLEKAVMNQASRLVSMDIDSVTGNDIEMLSADDFEAPAAKPRTKPTIGFAL